MLSFNDLGAYNSSVLVDNVVVSVGDVSAFRNALLLYIASGGNNYITGPPLTSLCLSYFND